MGHPRYAAAIGIAALSVAVAVVALAACPHGHPVAPPPSAPTPNTPPPSDAAPAPVGPPRITWRRVTSPADVPREPPAAGAYRIHLIDVGTGLSLLVQGHDFALLYDAGSNDRDETPLRVVAYLAAALGPSGDDLCVSPGAPRPTARVPLAHAVLSHPHFDHGSAMDLVIHCYDVGDFWDSGRVTDTTFYRDVIAALARATTTTYHTAAEVPRDHVHSVKGAEATLPRWERFSEGDTVALGAGARFTILRAESKAFADANENSVVLAVELGATRLLLTGDAEAGGRKEPSAAPGQVEAFLLAQHTPALRADILQVGHHGSKTSSRHAFLAAVHPTLALVSSGPKPYAHTVLPDPAVIEELARDGATVLRTDAHDGACDLPQRIGGDHGPGGCDTYIIDVTP